MLRTTTARTFSTSQLPKVFRTRRVLHIFTSKCASGHNGLQFFDISTSKRRPNVTVLDTFDFKMCFAPHQRALFQHLNFQKRSGAEVFLHFYFRMCFAPERRAIFQHLNFQKCSGAEVSFTSKYASRHNGVEFFIFIWPAGSTPAALASLLFVPPEPQNNGKT